MKKKNILKEADTSNIEFPVLFHEFIQETKSIPVNCIFDIDSRENIFISMSVSGCSSEHEFKKKLRELLRKGINDTIMNVESLPREDKIYLLRNLIDDLKNWEKNSYIEGYFPVYERHQPYIEIKLEIFKNSKYDFIKDEYYELKIHAIANHLNKYYQCFRVAINEAISLLENEITEIIKLKELDAINNKGIKNKKLKTTLTVSQLSYFFKALNDLKIFDYKHKTELFAFISNNFQTKGTENLSTKSIKNKIDTPDPSAIDFWVHKFKELESIAKKD